MTWTKLSDDFTDRLALHDAEISRSARYLLVEMYVWSNRMLTDGRIKIAALPKLTDSPEVDVELLELERAGLITSSADRRSWQLDWSDQLGKAEVDDRREAQKVRKERSRRHLAGDHSQCLPTAKCSKPVTRDITRDPLRESQPPDPTRPARRSRAGDKPPGPRCIHNQPIASDGARCAQCVEAGIADSSHRESA